MEHLSPPQLKTLRQLFNNSARRRGDASAGPTISSSDLHRILSACGIRLTESDANALVLKADTTGGSGSSGLCESDFLQIMSLALSDCDLGQETDALYDKIAAMATASSPSLSSSSSSSTPALTLGALSAFLEQLRKEPGVGPTVPPFTKAELAAFFADASTQAAATPGKEGKEDADDNRVISLSRDDFQRLMHLQIASAPAGMGL